MFPPKTFGLATPLVIERGHGPLTFQKGGNGCGGAFSWQYR